MSVDPGSVIHDSARLAALADTGVMDSPVEVSFDRLTRLASRLLRSPTSLVSLVDESRQFFKSAAGLPEPWCTIRQTPLSHSFCRHVVESAEPLVVNDARTDPILQHNGAVSDLGVIAYLGIPLKTGDGHVLGSFCVIEGVPREWTDADIETMTDLAASVATELELRRDLIRQARLESKLRETQESLRRSEAESRHMAMVAARTDGAVVIADAESRIEWVNASFTRLFGLTSDQASGRDVIECLMGRSADPSTIARLRDDLDAGDLTSIVTIQGDDMVRKAWVEFEIQPVPGEEGTPPHVIAIGRDITARRLSEARLAAQYACTRVLSESTGLDHVVGRLLGAICGVLDLAGGEYWKVNEAMDVVLLEDSWWAGPDVEALIGRKAKERHCVLGDGIPGAIWRDGKAREIPDFATDPDFQRKADAAVVGLRSGFALPVRGERGVSGVIFFFNKGTIDEPGSLLEVAENLGQQIGVFVERSEAEFERKRLATIVEACDDFVGMADPQGRCLWVNAAFSRAVAFEDGKPHIGRSIDEYSPEWAHKLLWEVGWPEATRYGSWVGETAIRRANGPDIPVMQTILAQRDDHGQVSFYATIIRDLTSQKQSEAALLDNQRFIQNIVEATPALIYTFGLPEKRFLWTNGRDSAMLGRSSDYLTSLGRRSVDDLWHPDDLPVRERLIAESETLEDGQVLELEYRLPHADGSWRWFRNRLVVSDRDDYRRPTRQIGALEDINPPEAGREPLPTPLRKEHRPPPDLRREGRHPRLQRRHLPGAGGPGQVGNPGPAPVLLRRPPPARRDRPGAGRHRVHRRHGPTRRAISLRQLVRPG